LNSLHKRDFEILKLQTNVQEKEDINDHLKIKSKDMEQTVKLERKKSKKEKQQQKRKLAKPDSSLESKRNDDDDELGKTDNWSKTNKKSVY
jgi:hypothetical protein